MWNLLFASHVSGAVSSAFIVSRMATDDDQSRPEASTWELKDTVLGFRALLDNTCWRRLTTQV